MILPLGLGFRFLKLPITTIVLCLVSLVFYFKDPARIEKVNEKILRTFAAQNMGAIENQLFQEYCGQEGGTGPHCAEIGKYLESSYETAADGKKRKEKNKTAPGNAFGFEGSAGEEMRYVSIINQFRKLLRKPDEKFENLPHFDNYQVAMEQVRSQLTTFYKSENLLSAQNLGPRALFTAQFTHASLTHLLGNLVFLFLFGAYVEARVGALAFLMVYLIGGSAGLLTQVAFFAPPEQFLVGASANVSAIMGMFFVLFFRFRMRFLVWYLVGRTFYAPVSYTFPFLFILSEVVGGLQGISYGGTEVAHFAHLGGILLGIYAAFTVEALQAIPWPFIYPDEPEKYRLMKNQEGLAKKIAAGKDILKYNPQNYVTRRYLLNQCLEYCNQQALIDSPVLLFLRENSMQYLEDCARNKNEDACFKFLGQFPHHLSFQRVFEGMNSGAVIKLGDGALNHGDLFLAMKFYDFFLMRFPKSRKVKSLTRTLEEVIRHFRLDAETDRAMEFYRRGHPESVAMPMWDQRGRTEGELTPIVAA